MPTKYNFLWLKPLLFILIVFSFGLDLEVQADVSRTDRTIKIMTSVFPLAEFARAVGGDFSEVEMLLPPGAEVHTWQLRPSDISKLSRADLFIYIGKQLEPWISEILRGAMKPDLVVLEAAQGLLIGEHEHHHGHDTEEVDPHVWLDFEYDGLIITRIADALCELDPDHSSFFRSHAEAYQDKLHQLDQKYRISLQECKNRTFLVGGHAAFGHLAKKYNLNQIALFGISPDSRPTPRKLKEVVDLARENDAQAIFMETFVSDELARVVSREVGLRMLELNPGANLSRAQSDAGLSFFDIMEKNLENLKDGLSCK